MKLYKLHDIRVIDEAVRAVASGYIPNFNAFVSGACGYKSSSGIVTHAQYWHAMGFDSLFTIFFINDPMTDGKLYSCDHNFVSIGM